MVFTTISQKLSAKKSDASLTQSRRLPPSSLLLRRATSHQELSFTSRDQNNSRTPQSSQGNGGLYHVHHESFQESTGALSSGSPLLFSSISLARSTTPRDKSRSKTFPGKKSSNLLSWFQSYFTSTKSRQRETDISLEGFFGKENIIPKPQENPVLERTIRIGTSFPPLDQHNPSKNAAALQPTRRRKQVLLSSSRSTPALKSPHSTNSPSTMRISSPIPRKKAAQESNSTPPIPRQPLSQFQIRRTLRVFGLPLTLKPLIIRAIEKQSQGVVSQKVLVKHLSYLTGNFTSLDHVLYKLMSSAKTRHEKGVKSKEILQLIHDIIHVHPAFFFLRGQDNTKEYFVEAIYTRLLYDSLGPLTWLIRRDHRFTFRQFKRLRLASFLVALESCQSSSDESMPSAFSYQEFYVCFGQFWELDLNDRKKLSVDDVQSFIPSIPAPILERAFEWTREIRGGNPEEWLYLTFEEFLDKESEAALCYWFQVLDSDRDGRLSHKDLEFIWEEPQCGSRAVIQPYFFVHMTQDLFQPKNPDFITLQDLKQHPSESAYWLELVLNAHVIPQKPGTPMDHPRYLHHRSSQGSIKEAAIGNKAKTNFFGRSADQVSVVQVPRRSDSWNHFIKQEFAMKWAT